MQKKPAIIVGIVLVLLVAGVFLLPKGQGGSTKLNGFAQCLKDKGATFYGAWWCPHCQSQKALFEASVSLLPYVECSNPDKSQNALCNEKKIESYPTWDFADGSRTVGELTLDELAEKTGCTLPQ